jgi:hypothetical protein
MAGLTRTVEGTYMLCRPSSSPLRSTSWPILSLGIRSGRKPGNAPGKLTAVMP